MINVKVGDTVIRMLAGAVAMPLTVTAVDDQYITCGAWVFERDSGVEYDPDLCWGSEFGRTGSFIIEPSPPIKEQPK